MGRLPILWGSDLSGRGRLGLLSVLWADLGKRMNDKELCEELGIVRVAGYWRRAAYEPWTYVWVRAHYRASPGTGPIETVNPWGWG